MEEFEMRQSIIFLSISIALLLVFSCAPAADDTADNGTPPPDANGDTNGTPDPDGNGIVDEPVEDEAEGLFDSYSKPDDWPTDVPLMRGFTVYEYENTDAGMHAFAKGEEAIDWVSNLYHNMFIAENTSFDWVQDPDNATIEEGDEQAFYCVKEGWALAILVVKLDENMTSTDLTLTPTG